MINSSRQLDEIDGGSTDPVLVKQILEYDIPYSLSGTELVYADWVIAYVGYGSAGAPFKIPVGTAMPFNRVYAASLQPTVTFAIPKNSTTLTTNGTSGMTVEYVYATSAMTLLASLNIYGNDDGTGHFNEDTWVKIVP